MLGLQVGGQINPDMIDRIKLIIKRHFEEKGFKNATVDVVQRDDVTGDNRVMLDINIKKNGKVKVKHIYLTGVDEKEAKKLKRAMKKTHEKTLLNLFKSKKFLPEKYEEDKGYLIDKMNEWGFRDALVLRDSVATLDEEHVDIYIDLYKGDKYYLRSINWVGNTVFTTDALNTTLKLSPGDVYNQSLLNKRLQEDEDAIGVQYYNMCSAVSIPSRSTLRTTPSTSRFALAKARKPPSTMSASRAMTVCTKTSCAASFAPNRATSSTAMPSCAPSMIWGR